MAFLKLVKGRSYTMNGFSCNRDVPFSIEDDKADILLKSGRFEQLDEIENSDDDVDDGSDKEPSDIDSMKVEELRKYASENEIDITGLKKKDEILEVIRRSKNTPVDDVDFDADDSSDKGSADDNLTEDAGMEDLFNQK